MTTEPNALPGIAPGQVEIWKKIVDVQQHFNDLELRVRNFALVVTGAFLGLGGYAIKDGGAITLFGHVLSIAGLVVLSAILPLLAFYFMDRFWYHRLLDGSVKAGIEAEAALKALGYQVDLGTQISRASPFTLWPTKHVVHSKSKMDMFYGMLLLALLIVAAGLSFGIRPQLATAAPTSTPVAINVASPAPASLAPVPEVKVERPAEPHPHDPAAKEPAAQ
jgi:hypothetical protein